MFRLLVISVALVLVCLTNNALSVSLKEVCSGKGSIGSLDEARHLIDEAKLTNNGEQQCPNEYKNSFIELEKVVFGDNIKDVCSENTFKAIKSFHQNFISIYDLDYDKDQLQHKTKNPPIPKGVSDYFITFASDVALLCSKKLMERFNNELKAQQFQIREINEFKNVRKILLEYLDSASGKKIYNRQEPKHINELKIRSHEDKADEQPQIHLVIGGAKKSDLTRVIDACRVRYNKVSSEIFEPTVRLLALGYGVGRWSMQETMSLLSHEYVPWILALDTCNLLDNIDIVIDSNDSNEQPRLVDQEEALKLKKNQQHGENKKLLDFDSPLPLDINHESVEFKQLTGQKNVRDVVAKFKTENDRLIKVKTGKEDKPSLNDAFSVYENEAIFTTERPANIFERVTNSWGIGR